MPDRPPPPEPQRGLGAAVRQLRKQAGLTQGALGDRAGVSASLISRIESGNYDPTWGDVRRVAAGLEISLERLSEVAAELEDS